MGLRQLKNILYLISKDLYSADFKSGKFYNYFKPFITLFVFHMLHKLKEKQKNYSIDQPNGTGFYL